MNPFWTREARLARRLKAERPEPSRQFLGSMLERLDAAQPVTHRRSFGLRVGLASTVSLAFLTSLAAFGGLGYAATSIAHVGRTASHVVIPQHRAHPTPVEQNTAADSSQATSSADATQSSSRGDSQSNTGDDSSAESDFSFGGGSADDQYNNQFVCVLFSPHKYNHIIRLPRFLVPFFLARHPSAVVVPCPPPRHGRGG
jgi:hypothetical protein